MTVWIFAAFLTVVVAEMIFSSTWNRLYFSWGVPVFRQELLVPSPRPEPPSPQRLEGRLRESARQPFRSPIEFHQLDGGRLAFRERRIGQYSEVMRGLLRFDRQHGLVEVTGFLNWFVPVLVAAALVLLVSAHEPVFIVVLTGIIALLYAIQARRFREVAADAVQEWSNVS